MAVGNDPLQPLDRRHLASQIAQAMWAVWTVNHDSPPEDLPPIDPRFFHMAETAMHLALRNVDKHIAQQIRTRLERLV